MMSEKQNGEPEEKSVPAAGKDEAAENAWTERKAAESAFSNHKNRKKKKENGSSVLKNVTPAETFSNTEIAAAVDRFYEEKLAAEEYDAEMAELMSKSFEVDDTEPERWEESAESASEAPDEAAFTEELIEEEVTGEEAAEAVSEEDTDDSEITEDDIIEDDMTEDDIIEETVTVENDSVSGDDTAAKTALGKENNTEEAEASDKDITAEAAPQNIPEEKKGFIWGIIPCKGDSVFEIIRKIIFICAVTVFIGAGVMLARTLIDSRKAQKDAEIIKDIVTTTAATSINEAGEVVTIAPTREEEIQHNIDVMKYFKDISENVIGIIELEGCDLYQPVVQGDDNDYYLTHTYYDEINKGGAVFADHRCVFTEEYCSPNIVLYGHNQEDGTMFGNLQSYKQNTDFYAANPTVTFNTEYGLGTYLIYGYFITNALENQDSNGEVFHYHDYIETMNDEATFNWYMKEVQRRNQIVSPVEVEFGDQLLCLSTCSNEFSNSRFVVFARKLREGESVSDYDFGETYLNPHAKGVDWTAIMSGMTEETEETEETTRKKLKTRREETEEPEAEDNETEKKTKKKKDTSAESETEETVKTKKTKKETESAVTEPPVTETEETATETAGVNENGAEAAET